MVGKNCFAIASDRRLGVQLQTIATDFRRVFKVHDKLYIGLSGLATDAQTLWVSRILDSFGFGAPFWRRGPYMVYDLGLMHVVVLFVQVSAAGVQAQVVPADGGEGHEARNLCQPCFSPPL
jgi:hypothetical protein